MIEDRFRSRYVTIQNNVLWLDKARLYMYQSKYKRIDLDNCRMGCMLDYWQACTDDWVLAVRESTDEPDHLWRAVSF